MLALAAGAGSINDDDNLLQWDAFKKMYNKEYVSEEEESKKYLIFLDNLKRIDCKYLNSI